MNIRKIAKWIKPGTAEEIYNKIIYKILNDELILINECSYNEIFNKIESLDTESDSKYFYYKIKYSVKMVYDEKKIEFKTKIIKIQKGK